MEVDRREFIYESLMACASLMIPGQSQAKAEVIPLGNNKFKAIFARADHPNSNGRVYPKEVLEKAVKNFNNRGTDDLLGHLGVPRTTAIQLSEVSHVVNNLYMEDNYLKGDIIVLQTPKGKVLRELMDKVVFRPSGIGKLRSEGENWVVSDYKLLSVDAMPEEEAARL